MNPLLRGVAVCAFVLLGTAPVKAGSAGTLKTFELEGEVFDASPALAAYGVHDGAPVHVTWTVNLSAPVYAQHGPPDNRSDYVGATTFIVIEIGDWLAILVPPVVPEKNFIAVSNDSGGSLDLLHVEIPGTDNDLVLHQVNGFLNLSLDFYDLFGDASSNQTLDQNPALYPIGLGQAWGPGGSVLFHINGSGGGGGGGGVVDPEASCHKSQLAAAGKLCQSQLKCRSKFAKDPAKDPGKVKLTGCHNKAAESFTKAYDKALATADRKGLTCPTEEPAADQRTAIEAHVDAIHSAVEGINPTHEPLNSAWLGASATACGGALKAESAHAGKPNAAKRDQAREKAQDKLESAAQKAADKAEGKGVVFTPDVDPSGFADFVDATADAIAALFD